MIATIDTMAAVERLEQAGIATAQAKALVGVFAEANRAAIDNLATKDELKTGLAEIRTEIAGSANKTIGWLIATMLVMDGLLFAGLKLLQ